MRDPSREDPAVLHLMRVTIEAVSPLSFGSGERVLLRRRRRAEGRVVEEDKFEIALVRDANELPTIPGATLQGVLRQLYADECGSAETRDLFGFAEGSNGSAARLSVGFGCVHDREGRSIERLVTNATRISDDPVLSSLRRTAPVTRDHVALNARHVSDGRKKFERPALPVGTRFSIEFSLWGLRSEAESDKQKLERVAQLFRHPVLRLGGSGRRGYGKVILVRASHALPALDNTQALRSLREQAASRSLADAIATNASRRRRGVVQATLSLTPINVWRIGGRSVPVTEMTHGVRLPDGSTAQQNGVDLRHAVNADGSRKVRDADDIATLARETIIRWVRHGEVERAELVEATAESPFDPARPRAVPFAIPGSAIKGPLAHRAVFHWNCGRANGERLIDVEQWLQLGPADRERRLAAYRDWAKRPEDLELLLGAAKERDSDEGRASRVFVDDGSAAEARAVQAIDHSSIDRFTGGVRAGFLFVEEVIVGGRIEVEIFILPPLQEAATGTSPRDWSGPIRDAFLKALRDLCEGRLAIGAKSLGFCTGTVTWGGDPAQTEAWQRAWDSLSRPSA
ncbi:MAG: RAMP superfamily CRISPR-associated protein, partial [Hyphomicrobiales bacterium]